MWIWEYIGVFNSLWGCFFFYLRFGCNSSLNSYRRGCLAGLQPRMNEQFSGFMALVLVFPSYRVTCLSLSRARFAADTSHLCIRARTTKPKWKKKSKKKQKRKNRKTGDCKILISADFLFAAGFLHPSAYFTSHHKYSSTEYSLSLLSKLPSPMSNRYVLFNFNF